MIYDLPPTAPVRNGYDALTISAVKPGLAVAVEDRFTKTETDVTNLMDIPAKAVAQANLLFEPGLSIRHAEHVLDLDVGWPKQAEIEVTSKANFLASLGQIAGSPIPETYPVAAHDDIGRSARRLTSARETRIALGRKCKQIGVCLIGQRYVALEIEKIAGIKPAVDINA